MTLLHLTSFHPLPWWCNFPFAFVQLDVLTFGMVISKRFTREQGVIHQYSLFFYEITISSKVDSLTWHLLMFSTFLFHLSIISSGNLDINMQRVTVESNAFHLWLNVMLLHFNRKVWNFRQALASPNSICGHFMLGSYVYFHIYSLADVLHTYCKTFIGWQSVFLRSLYLTFNNFLEQGHEMVIVQHIAIKRLHIYLWCCVKFQKFA